MKKNPRSSPPSPPLLSDGTDHMGYKSPGQPVKRDSCTAHSDNEFSRESVDKLHQISEKWVWYLSQSTVGSKYLNSSQYQRSRSTSQRSRSVSPDSSHFFGSSRHILIPSYTNLWSVGFQSWCGHTHIPIYGQMLLKRIPALHSTTGASVVNFPETHICAETLAKAWKF